MIIKTTHYWTITLKKIMVAGDDNDNDDDEIVFILLINQHIYSVNEEMLLREKERERMREISFSVAICMK